MSTASLASRALDQGQGIVRLTPTWVPRSFCVPGRRIKLHPHDYYALGGERGGIDERWFASTTPADNGPLTSENEGLSHIIVEGETCLLRDAVAELKGGLIGSALWDTFGKWPMFSKFFDNKGALPHHIHHREPHASRVGQMGKPEAYYFSPQVNNYGADFPYTFFGLRPGTTKDEVIAVLKAFTEGDNNITGIAQAYRLEVGTGWDVPPGILHAPGSMCTYEPQAASDVFAMYQSLVGDQVVPEELLWKDTPEDEKGNFDYLLDVIDWEANVDPDFAAKHFMKPKPVKPAAEMEAEGYSETWICYKSRAYSAKELTVHPGQTVTIKDGAPYGMILLQGHGSMGVWNIETPTLIRYGQLTFDEFFVSEEAAQGGVQITNNSPVEDLVMLKHFAADNPDLVVE